MIQKAFWLKPESNSISVMEYLKATGLGMDSITRRHLIRDGKIRVNGIAIDDFQYVLFKGDFILVGGDARIIRKRRNATEDEAPSDKPQIESHRHGSVNTWQEKPITKSKWIKK